MRPPKYPLEPLAELREKKADDAVRGLATAVARADAARRERTTAEARRDEHRDAAERLRQDEARALSRGELCVADLARADAWEVRVAGEREALASTARSARSTEAQAREIEQQARAHVAARRAEADAVAKDRARWTDRLQRRVDAKEEEDASEAWRPKG
jgi:hypothetical protein